MSLDVTQEVVGVTVTRDCMASPGLDPLTMSSEKTDLKYVFCRTAGCIQSGPL